MFTHYVEDVSVWEKWQQKYRYGVFLLLPSEPLMTQANAIREQYDKLSAAACDAHISLTIPLPQPVLSVHWIESFSAHLTLAEFIDVERTKELMIELSDSIPQGHFDCTAVSYAVPDESFRFIERAMLVLG